MQTRWKSFYTYTHYAYLSPYENKKYIIWLCTYYIGILHMYICVYIFVYYFRKIYYYNNAYERATNKKQILLDTFDVRQSFGRKKIVKLVRRKSYSFIRLSPSTRKLAFFAYPSQIYCLNLYVYFRYCPRECLVYTCARTTYIQLNM